MADRRIRLAAVAAAVLLSAGCTSFADTVADGAAPSGAAGTPAPSAGNCPGKRAEPDPDRPRIALEFTLDDDLTTVTGTERVVFTPDLPTDELVFRLVPNGPGSGDNELTVDAVRGDDVAGGGYEADEAEDPGGLYVVRLDDQLAAGTATTVDLNFTLRLGGGTFDRFGRDDGVSWWASGQPLLAWEPGVGWHRDPFVPVLGETATSPVADTSISVSAPEDLTVLMTGDQAEPGPAQDGRRTWTSAEPVARDVAVAAGTFRTAEARTGDGVRVTAGSLRGQADATDLAQRTVDAIEQLEELVGPFPYRTQTMIGLANYGGGIEYPSAVLMAARDDVVLVHEVAHMWFYGMVGNSQFRDPWLDEAFATWAESVVEGGPAFPPSLDLPGDVGAPMDAWDDEQDYFATVYGKGASALLEAQDRAGAPAFDAAVRCYVDAEAWSIATPDDVATALADLPQARDVLVDAGALD